MGAALNVAQSVEWQQLPEEQAKSCTGVCIARVSRESLSLWKAMSRFLADSRMALCSALAAAMALSLTARFSSEDSPGLYEPLAASFHLGPSKSHLHAPILMGSVLIARQLAT